MTRFVAVLVLLASGCPLVEPLFAVEAADVEDGSCQCVEYRPSRLTPDRIEATQSRLKAGTEIACDRSTEETP